jgi:hypothetical protein
MESGIGKGAALPEKPCQRQEALLPEGWNGVENRWFLFSTRAMRA